MTTETALAVANLVVALIGVALVLLLVLPRLDKLHPRREDTP